MTNLADNIGAQNGAYFINSEATKYNCFNSFHDAWIRQGIVVTSIHDPLPGKTGTATSRKREINYCDELNKLEKGSIVLLWVNKTHAKKGTPTGVVAAGVIADEKNSCVTVSKGEMGKVSPYAREEFHRKVNWKYDLTKYPISCAEIRQLFGSNPSKTILSLGKTSRDDILNVVTKRGNELYDAVQAEQVQRDLDEIDRNPLLSPTEKETHRLARVGQGKYRNELLKLWNGQCAVTGCGLGAVLRASHIKPWKSSDDLARLDPNNGLPLLATLDALFDRGMISFADNGHMLLSPTLSKEDIDLLGLPKALRLPLNDRQRKYLEYHRSQLVL